jgi:hypothetical protein
MSLTYEQLTDQVLRLIDEYSKKGTANPVSKTADYRLKIPDAVNEIQQDLANDKGKLEKELSITNTTATYPTETTIALPADWLNEARVMQQIYSVYWVPFTYYRITPTSFVYNSRQAGTIIITYNRIPTAIAVADTSNPTVAELAQVIDVIAEATYIVPAGVAGKILMVDNPSGSAELFNYYEARKYALRLRKSGAAIETIVDVYGGL